MSKFYKYEELKSVFEVLQKTDAVETQALFMVGLKKVFHNDNIFILPTIVYAVKIGKIVVDELIKDAVEIIQDVVATNEAEINDKLTLDDLREMDKYITLESLFLSEKCISNCVPVELVHHVHEKKLSEWAIEALLYSPRKMTKDEKSLAEKLEKAKEIAIREKSKFLSFSEAGSGEVSESIETYHYYLDDIIKEDANPFDTIKKSAIELRTWSLEEEFGNELEQEHIDLEINRLVKEFAEL